MRGLVGERLSLSNLAMESSHFFFIIFCGTVEMIIGSIVETNVLLFPLEAQGLNEVRTERRVGPRRWRSTRSTVLMFAPRYVRSRHRS